jgi:hypothetical protein
VNGDNVLVDEELEAALDTDLKQAWKTFSPTGGGRMNFRAHVERLPPNQPPDVDVTITATGCTIRPAFFPYALADLRGTIRYARHWVHLQDLRARHGNTVLTIDEGKIFLKPKGGVWSEVTGLQGSPLIPDVDLLRALPPGLARVCQSLELHDALRLRMGLTVDAPPGGANNPVIFWDAQLAFEDASLRAGVALEHVRGRAACLGRHNGQDLEGLVGNLAINQAMIFNQPFRDVQAEIEVKKESPGVLALKGLHGRFFGGEVYGPVRVEFGPRIRYELKLTASRVNLEEFGKHNLHSSAELNGLATAQLHLTGQGLEPTDVQGDGTVDVPNGRLYNLPLLLDLLKFLGLHLPDGTAFEEAHAVFAVRGMRVAVSRLDLFGNSISLRGQGEMNLDGTDINLDFYAVWARIMQYLPPLIKEIPPYLSQSLLRIKMRGRVGDVQFTKEPVPALVDPLKEMLDRLAGRGEAATRH